MSDEAQAKRRLVVPPTLYRSVAYQRLRPSARLMFEEMVKMARRLKGDGWLTLGERAAAEILGVDRKTARAALRQLESLGFLVCLQRGRYARKRLASNWRITCFGFQSQPPTRDYEQPETLRKIWRAEAQKKVRKLKGVPFLTPGLEIEVRMRRQAA
jgi:hypothetical protein